MNTKKKYHDYAGDVVHRYFHGRYTAEVERDVQHWLIDRTDTETKFRALETEWNALKVDSTTSVARSYRRVWARIRHSEAESSACTRRRMMRRMAAVFVPALTIAAVLLYVLRGVDSGQNTWVDFSVSHGQTAELQLPDGSRVTLNAGSTVSYPEAFGERSVKLSGEAFFDVASDPARPFAVQTQSMTVRVTGTEFNVSAFPDMGREAVSVVSGAVEVFVAEDTCAHRLHRGERLTFDKTQGGVTLDAYDLSGVSWRTGALEFADNTCEEILRMIGRRYDLPVHLPGEGSSERYTVKFTGEESVEEVLYVLENLIPYFSCDLREDGVYVEFQ